VRRALALSLCLFACEGPIGPRGYPGGSLDGAAALDAAVEPHDAGDRADRAALEEASALDANTNGLTGRVRDPSGSTVAGGRVVLVPTAEVARLASTAIDLTLDGLAASLASNDEPLEDLLASERLLPSAAVGADGSFRFEPVPDGEAFVVYVPAADDALHLPGGELARTPFAAESLRGATLELRVSGAPSARARYIGSASCLNCHARHSLFASGHALTLRIPGVSSAHQELSAGARIDEALGAFVADAQLYFSDCGAGPLQASDCRVSTSPPAAPAQLRVRLGRDPTLRPDEVGSYFVELSSAAGAVQRHPLALTLGGSRGVQQFVVRSALAGGGFTHFVLPFSYQLAGDDARLAAADQRWVAYRLQDWLELASGALRTPDNANAFERQCAGCHSTGFVARGSAIEGYRGSAVAEPDGVYDLDGDGRKELLAVGCEACHGPGSEHLELVPRGQRIVSPGLLTPERQSLLCGVCHARHLGKGGEQAPLDEMLRMPRAGTSRAAFLAQHVSRIESSEPPLFPTGDAKVRYQQYGDFLRSPKYRSAKLLVTCSDCHDAHRGAGHVSDLRQPKSNESCAACHAAQRDVTSHVAASIRFPHDVGVHPELLTCTQCHMVKSATSGARSLALRDATDPDPARHQQYLHGDRASHRFVFVDRSHAAEQPVAATLGCAPCHGELLPVP